jgi:hypothetical protein
MSFGQSEGTKTSSLSRGGQAAEVPVSLHIVHPGNSNDVAQKIDALTLGADSNVTLVLAAGSNTELNADETVIVAKAIAAHATKPEVRVVVRVDQADAGNIGGRTTEILKVVNECRAAGIACKTIIQAPSNSTNEAAQSANPTPDEREKIGTPTHLVQVVQADALARRVKNGFKRGFHELPDGEHRPQSVTILSQATLPKGARRTEKLGKILALVADTLEDNGVPLRWMRGTAQRIKAAFSTRKREQ